MKPSLEATRRRRLYARSRYVVAMDADDVVIAEQMTARARRPRALCGGRSSLEAQMPRIRPRRRPR